jgi:hypothetical protein
MCERELVMFFRRYVLRGILLFQSKFWPESLTGLKSNAWSIYTTKNSTEILMPFQDYMRKGARKGRKGDEKS